MTSLKLRVVLADDHLVVRQGLRHLVDEQPDMEVVAEAGDGPEAVRLCEALSPDVALVDISMPPWDGVQTAQALTAACPRMKLVSVTRHDDETFVRRILAVGAAGYVLKQSSSIQLTNAVRAVARGEQYVDPAIRRVAEVLFHPATIAAAARPPAAAELTDLEIRVLRLAATSHSGREIGEQVGLNAGAVANVKAGAMAKLGLRTRTQLIDYARRHGWFEPRG